MMNYIQMNCNLFSSASQIKVHGHIKRLSGSFAGWKNLYSFSSFGSSGSGASMGSSATIDTLGAGLFEALFNFAICGYIRCDDD